MLFRSTDASGISTKGLFKKGGKDWAVPFSEALNLYLMITQKAAASSAKAEVDKDSLVPAVAESESHVPLARDYEKRGSDPEVLEVGHSFFAAQFRR